MLPPPHLSRSTSHSSQGAGRSGSSSQRARLVPCLLYVKVLFCGLPLSVGGASLAIGRSDVTAAVEEVEQFLAELAATVRPLVICYKEFADGQEVVGDALLDLGYVGFETPPMHRFTHRFRDLDDYLGNLRSHYRYDIRRSMRKAERMGLAIRRITGFDEIDAVYSDRVHKLYCAVVENSDYKLELLPRSFFVELARELQGRVGWPSP
jgi:predicted N-acyltransferase